MRIKRIKANRIISCVLVLNMLLFGYPFQLFGLSANAAEEPVYVIKELEEYRNEYSKTFLNSDDKLVSIVSSQPLHYKENKQDKVWKNIDNTLTLVKGDNGKDVLKTQKGKLSAELPEDFDQESPIRVSYNGYTLSMLHLEVKSTKAIKQKKKRSTIKNPHSRSSLNFLFMIRLNT